MNSHTDRLWTRPETMSPEAREQARRTIERDPSLLEGPILAALGTIEGADRIAARMLDTIRGVRPCTS